ncbi:MAG TPA: thioesterase family protein [Thermodesulfobacteriota bacterium]|nr:thioesterase family protein [Thermodesulfobacteriota bacterium]
MARIKLDLPENFHFSTEIQVRISDINYGGHLGHDSILSLTHEARIRFLNKYGFSEMNIDGVGLIISDAALVYKSESFYGETLRIEIAVLDFSQYGCDFIYKITEKESVREIARAKTGIVFFDYEKRKVAPVPEKFKSKFI